MPKQKLKFPEGFLWGAATSSYQIEGDNVNSDWWAWEQQGKTKDISGDACDYWHRWKSDHDLLSELGVNAFRLSIEWSRFEPQEGEFSSEAIEHYRQLLQDLKKRNIKTVVTFWHWVSPQWFQEKYGLHRTDSVEIFARYGKRIIDELGDLIDIVVTINEPAMPLVFGFLLGKYPPGKMNWLAYKKASKNLAAAHKEIYKYSKEKNENIPVGITMLYNFFEPANKNNPLDRLVVALFKRFWNDSFPDSIKGHMDYVGLDYYFHRRLSIFGQRNENKKTTDVGWEIYPVGIYEVLKELKEKYVLPIYIMENGLADAKDAERTAFIENHLLFVHKAIAEGVPVRGYFHWSLLDNYEWLYGYGPRFGLVEIDYETLSRHPRQSFYEYAKICKENAL